MSLCDKDMKTKILLFRFEYAASKIEKPREIVWKFAQCLSLLFHLTTLFWKTHSKILIPVLFWVTNQPDHVCKRRPRHFSDKKWLEFKISVGNQDVCVCAEQQILHRQWSYVKIVEKKSHFIILWWSLQWAQKHYIRLCNLAYENASS